MKNPVRIVGVSIDVAIDMTTVAEYGPDEIAPEARPSSCAPS